MFESRRLGQEWKESELIVVLDLYFNGSMTDSHGHDEYAKLLGRYNAGTDSFSDGGVNQKLAEIKGYIEQARKPRHPGENLIGLISRLSGDLPALCSRAAEGWREILQGYDGPVPKYIRDLLARNPEQPRETP